MDKKIADELAEMFNGKVVGAEVLPDHAGGYLVKIFKPNGPRNPRFELELDSVGWVANHGEIIIANSDLGPEFDK